MIDILEVNKEIKMLEESNNTSYAVCNKLAILYIIRDHLKAKNNMIEQEKSENKVPTSNIVAKTL